MNCPMCGAPLNDGDQMCTNCGTRRSEMGPAYNRPAQPAQPVQNSYGDQGGSYGSNYGNSGNSENMGGNVGNYSNYGMDDSNAPYNNTGKRGRAYNPIAESRYLRRYKYRLIGGLITIIILLVSNCSNALFVNRKQTVNTGDFSVTLPQRMKEDSGSAFMNSDADNGKVYSNKNMAFAYIKYSMKEFGLTASDLNGLEEEFLTDLDKEFSNGLSGYSPKSKMLGYLTFYFTEDGTKYYADLTVEAHGTDLYMFVAYCKADDETKYNTFFRRMFKSIEYN